MANAFSTLHLHQFTDDYHIDFPGELKSSLTAIKYKSSEESGDALMTFKEINEFITAYHEYCENACAGDHGATARFWMQCINLVHDFINFSHALEQMIFLSLLR